MSRRSDVRTVIRKALRTTEQRRQTVPSPDGAGYLESSRLLLSSQVQRTVLFSDGEHSARVFPQLHTQLTTRAHAQDVRAVDVTQHFQRHLKIEGYLTFKSCHIIKDNLTF
jgi:hypothetical protein